MKQRPFAAFDIDGTLIRWQLYHAVTDNLYKRKLIKPEIYQSVHEQRMLWKKRQVGFKQYEKELVLAFESSAQSIPTHEIDKAMHEVITEYRDQVYTFTRDLIKRLQAKNYLLFAISGSHHEIIEQLAKYYGFDDWVGGHYKRQNGVLSGDYVGPLGRKREVLEELTRKHNATYEDSFAVGDSTGDISMLEAVEQPIAFNPEQELFEVAKVNGWKVVVERKNMVYELQPHQGGYLLHERR
jgi:HAD superfamily hydrolase (TIGR01490 family)